MKKIMVLGAGAMGSGIAQVVAQSGYSVVLCDVEERFVNKGLSVIRKNLTRQVEKGSLSGEQLESMLSGIQTTTDITAGAEVDLVIEAVTEDMNVKLDIYRKLDTSIGKEAILASNTSALSISALAAVTARPENVIGMHFFNPVPVMELVEITKGAATSEETYAKTKALVEKLGKTPVTVNEAPGFIVNRLLLPLINEAAYALMEGVAEKEDIDKAMKLGANHPIGPLALADFIGIDVCLSVMETLHREFGDTKYRPCPLLRKLVRAGYLGRKSGKGFYNY